MRTFARLVQVAAVTTALVLSGTPAHASGPDVVTCTGQVFYNPSPVLATSAFWDITCTSNPTNDDNGKYGLTTTFAPPAACPLPGQGLVANVYGNTPENAVVSGSGTYVTNNALFVSIDYQVREGITTETHHMVLQAPCAQGGAVVGAQFE